MNGEELGWRRECADADALLRHLGLNPEQCRTDGGWLNVARIKTLLAERSPRVALSDEQVLACIRSAQVGPVPMGMTRERGPYDVTEPTYFAQRFARAVIAEYERINGITPAQSGETK